MPTRTEAVASFVQWIRAETPCRTVPALAGHRKIVPVTADHHATGAGRGLYTRGSLTTVTASAC
jgi:hypothetical protein